MFYKKEDVNEAITCLVCCEIYADPRILPCGETTCSTCIKLDNESSSFECQLCKTTHTNPSDGFPQNAALLKLIKKNADEVYRGERVEQLKSKLTMIKAESDELRQKSRMDKIDALKEHCSSLRRQVESKTDRTIEEVQELNRALIIEIDEYESECLGLLKLNHALASTEKEAFLDYEAERFYSENVKYLQSFKIDESEVDRLNEMAVRFLNRLRKENVTLKEHGFNGRQILFTANDKKLKPGVLGQIDYKDYLEEKTKVIRTMKLSSKLLSKFEGKIQLLKVDNATNYLFYTDVNKQFNMLKVDNEGKLITQSSNIFNNIQANECRVLEVGEAFLFYASIPQPEMTYFVGSRLYYCEQANTSSQSVLLLTDKNLNYIKHEYFAEKIVHVAVNKTHILVIDACQVFNFLDLNFNYVSRGSLLEFLNRSKTELKSPLIPCSRTCSSSSDSASSSSDSASSSSDSASSSSSTSSKSKFSDFTLVRFIKGYSQIPTGSAPPSLDLADMEVINMNSLHVFLLIKNKKILVLNIKNFNLVKEIEVGVGVTQMKLVSSDYLAVFNSETNAIYFYDQSMNFEKVEEIQVDHTNRALSMAQDRSEFVSFCIKDSSSTKVLFYE
jgi:hypothetical protein